MAHFKKKYLLMFLLFFGGVFGLDTAVRSQETKQTGILEVIGTGRIKHDNVARARDEAIESGLWNAVEQGVGLLISSASVVSHFQLLNSRVYSQSKEFIHDYRVLTESKSGRYYRVVISATLLMNALREKLRDVGILMTGMEMPSVLLLLSEQNVGEVPVRYSWGTGSPYSLPLVTADAISSYMHDKGFVILSQEEVLTERRGLGAEGAPPKLNDKIALELAEEVGADVVIVGKASARFSGNILGTDMKSVEARLSVRAIDADKGIVIGSCEVTGAAVHRNEKVAGTEALGLAASAAAEDLSRQITANWGREASESVLVELLVKGIDEYADFVRFRTTLKDEVRGVKNVYLRAIKAGEAKMDVEVKGNAGTLADELMLKSFEGVGVNILKIGQNSIELGLMPKQNVRDELQGAKGAQELYRGNRSEVYPAH